MKNFKRILFKTLGIMVLLLPAVVYGFKNMPLYFEFDPVSQRWLGGPGLFSYKESVDICINGTKVAYSGLNTTNGSWDVYTSYWEDEKGARDIAEWNSKEKEVSLSKDCKNIAFTSNKDGKKDIWFSDFNGNYVRNLTGNAKIDMQDCNQCGDDGTPAWSLDGSEIFFTRCETKGTVTTNPNLPGCYYNLKAIDIKTKKVRNVLPENWNQTNTIDVTTAYEGNFLVFVNDANGVVQLYKTDYYGGKIEKLTDGMPNREYFPKISFDDRYIVFNYIDQRKKFYNWDNPEPWIRAFLMTTAGHVYGDVRMEDLFDRLHPIWIPENGGIGQTVGLRQMTVVHCNIK